MIAIACIVLSGVIFGYILGLLIQWKGEIVRVAKTVTVGLALSGVFVAYCLQSKVEYVSATIALVLFGMCGRAPPLCNTQP